jgi:DNA-binding MarR family transcriptional regulator
MMRKPKTSPTRTRAKKPGPAMARSQKSTKPVPAKKHPAPKSAEMTAARTGTRPPLPGQGKRGEAGHLGYLLRQAQAAARLTLERALSDLNVTPPQFAVLTMLKAYPGLSGADLARVSLLTPQTVGQIIRNLERAGAIRKTPHPVHGRVLQWSLTAKGAGLLGKCRRHAMALERRLASSLSARTEVTVRRWLAAVATELG